jgi:SAM-dependent methyltransferase
MNKKYQDLVIKDGKLVADWEKLYKDFDNPWKQKDPNVICSKSRLAVINYLSVYRIKSVVEIGCGLGFTTNFIHSSIPNIEIIGVDISHNAISKAKAGFPSLKFMQADIMDLVDIEGYDAFFMSEISWYLLEDEIFSKVLSELKETKRYKYLIHNLTFYKTGQNYGIDKFTKLQELIDLIPFRLLETFSYTEPEWNHIETSIIFKIN